MVAMNEMVGHMRRLITPLFAAVLVLLGAVTAATTAAQAATSAVHVTASAPGGPFVSGIAGQGYYAGFSTVTASNRGTTPTTGTSVRVDVPLSAGTATFTVTSTLAHRTCTSTITARAKVWRCPVAALAPGASQPVATIVGSESYDTGLPTSVTVRVIGPDGSVVPRTWMWVLPYSHLVATWTNLPTSVDWGAPVTATLTVTNNGIWPTTGSPTVAIRPSDPTQYNQGWLGMSWPSGYAQQYCGFDLASGSPDGLLCSLDPIAPGGSQVFTVTAYPVAPAGGALLLGATDSTGNFSVTAPPVAVVGTGARLSLSISNPSTVEAGTTFQRTYTVTNAGSTEALGVALSDMSYAFLVDGTTGPGTCAYHSAYRVGGRIDSAFGTVPANSSVTLVATLQAPAVSGTGTTFTAGAFASTTSPFVASGSSLTGSTSVTIYNKPILNLTPPTLTGTAQVGQVLTATWGTWSGTGSISLWAKLCHSNGGGCSGDIASTYTTAVTTTGNPSSTAFTYAIPAGDVGTDLVLYVSGQNDAGQVTLTTAPLGPVAP